MTDNEIIKALEKILRLMCREGDLQRSSTISHALDLIKRQKAEIEKLQKVIFKKEDTAQILHKKHQETVDELQFAKAEIERFQKEHDKNFEKWKILDERTKERYEELYQEAKEIVKIEAYKEFAERLRERFIADSLREAVNETLTELTERKEDEGK